jgi:hypothetical protein
MTLSFFSSPLTEQTPSRSNFHSWLHPDPNPNERRQRRAKAITSELGPMTRGVGAQWGRGRRKERRAQRGKGVGVARGPKRRVSARIAEAQRRVGAACSGCSAWQRWVRHGRGQLSLSPSQIRWPPSSHQIHCHWGIQISLFASSDPLLSRVNAPNDWCYCGFMHQLSCKLFWRKSDNVGWRWSNLLLPLLRWNVHPCAITSSKKEMVLDTGVVSWAFCFRIIVNHRLDGSPIWPGNRFQPCWLSDWFQSWPGNWCSVLVWLMLEKISFAIVVN